ncbi:MAG: arginine--tRNA ligase [Candidatus Aenigmatarchaeota archaeon]
MLEEEAIKALGFLGIEKIEGTLEVPPRSELGDLASTVCFQLAKKEKRNPKEIAEELVKKIKIPKKSLIKKVEAKEGYINFFFDWEKISEKVLKEIQKGKKLKEGRGKRIMVEYSQPNPVHPMHIGHARSTFLGDTLANALEFLGYKVIRANYMNNVGLQVAKLVTAYLLWGEGKEPEEKPDLWLWEFYVKFHEEASKNPELEEKARETLRKYEIEKDKKIIKIWNKVVGWCVKGFEETYRKLGIKFDVYFYESDFREFGKKMVEEGVKKGIMIKTEDGAVLSRLEKFGLPDTILLRSDSTGLYITSDLGMTVQRFKKYKLDKHIWVVSSEQTLHFKQLFKILEMFGYEWVKGCKHFSFELVKLPEGKMSSREGKAVMLDEVVEKICELAYEEVKKRNLGMGERKKRKLAREIGIGALKYAIVKIEPEKNITFDWNKMLKFEGDTGPYLQYAHTRCAGILRKAGKWKARFSFKELSEGEKELVKCLMKFDDVVEKAGEDLKPHYICNYAFELATLFDKFYETNPVLKAGSEERKNFRLTLVKATKVVLGNALKLIGIEPLERM